MWKHDYGENTLINQRFLRINFAIEDPWRGNESTEGFHDGELPLGEAEMEDVRREFEMRENRGS